MEFRKLAYLRVPTIGMGTWKTFDVGSERDLAVRRKIINECLGHGVTFIDSSPMYGRSEEVVGRTLTGIRDQFQLATKVWTVGREEGEAQIAHSFAMLDTEYIDVFQVHNLVDWRTQLNTLERLKDTGKIGVIGITHHEPRAFTAMVEIMKTGRVGAIQVPYNVGQRECEAEMLPLAADLGIGVIVMEPLQKGCYITDLKRVPDLGPLKGTGITTWAQALLAWVLADQRISVAIPATSRPERISENAFGGSGLVLDPGQRDYIRRETERCI